jgi:hypothetical protein
MVTHGCTGLAQSYDLGVGGGIGVADVAILAAADDASLAYDHRSHGDFSGFECALRRAQSFLHPQFVGSGRRSIGVGR